MSMDTAELQIELRSFGEELTREQIRKKPDIYFKKLNHYKAKQKQARDAQADGIQQTSDSMIIDELHSFGETVDLKSFVQKREIYIKKLNHLRARQRMAYPNGAWRTGASLNGRNEDNEYDYEDDEEDEEEKNLEDEEQLNKEEKYNNCGRSASLRADDSRSTIYYSCNTCLNSSALPSRDFSSDYTYKGFAWANASRLWPSPCTLPPDHRGEDATSKDSTPKSSGCSCDLTKLDWKNLVVLTNRKWKHPKYGSVQLRVEKKGPIIYGIVINVDVTHEGKKWKLMKVGITQRRVVRSTVACEHKPTAKKYNRLKDVMGQIVRKLPGVPVSVIFTQYIDPLDPRVSEEVEEDVRARCGIPIDNELTSMLKLPITTEWVLTTQNFICDLMDKKRADKIYNSKLFEGLTKPQLPSKTQPAIIINYFKPKFEKLRVGFQAYEKILRDELFLPGIMINELYTQRNMLHKFCCDNSSKNWKYLGDAIKAYRDQNPKLCWFMVDHKEKLEKLSIDNFKKAVNESATAVEDITTPLLWFETVEYSEDDDDGNVSDPVDELTKQTSQVKIGKK